MNGNDVRTIQKKLGLNNEEMAKRLSIATRTLGDLRKPDREVSGFAELALKSVWFGTADLEMDLSGDVGTEK